jgi:hypothetical protein
VTRGTLLGAIGGVVGACVGGAAVLTAVLPTAALWTSRFICGGRNELMINTSNYSYKPNQSGTSIGFQCVVNGGARDASFLAISALQTVLVALLLGGALAVGVVVRHLVRRQAANPAREILVGGVGLVALVVGLVLLGHAVADGSGPIQMAHGGSLIVHGNGESKSIACNDGYLTVDGRDETVTVTGHCAQLSVDGVIHHITVDSVDTINVKGVNNVVTYHLGTPKITNRGGANAVKQG